MGVVMAKHLITVDVDDEALAEAARLFGTTTPTETVNAALHDAVLRSRRLHAYDALLEMGQAGEFESLRDKRTYRR